MSKPWADTPFTLLPIPGTPNAPTCTDVSLLSVCVEMANVHNALLRGLNSIYLQAPHVTAPADIMDLMLYAKAWADVVFHHHSGEEKLLFPVLTEIAKEAGMEGDVMESNIVQHHAFEEGLNETMRWCEDVRAGNKDFDAKVLVELIDSFAPILVQHLHNEIDTLVKLDACDGKKIKKAMAETAQAAIKTADVYIVLPQIMGCIDRGYPGSGDFPPVPFFLPYLNAWWFSRRYKGCWRFNPCDHWGRPRPLVFL
ncbi:hypothetical protein CC86DRAFT_462780, partial [Ophiobolus disseminans]